MLSYTYVVLYCYYTLPEVVIFPLEIDLNFFGINKIVKYEIICVNWFFVLVILNTIPYLIPSKYGANRIFFLILDIILAAIYTCSSAYLILSLILLTRAVAYVT